MVKKLSLKDIRILIVDDNEVDQLVASRIIHKLTESIPTTVNCGEDAIDICKLQDFNLILMDLHMPSLDGLETTQLLLEDPKIVNVPIVAITGDEDTETKKRCLDSGMSAFIKKPFTQADLGDVIGEVIKKMK